jgi:hypothetical protein
VRQLYIRVVLSVEDPEKPSDINRQEQRIHDLVYGAFTALGRIEGLRVEDTSNVLLRRD